MSIQCERRRKICRIGRAPTVASGFEPPEDFLGGSGPHVFMPRRCFLTDLIASFVTHRSWMKVVIDYPHSAKLFTRYTFVNFERKTIDINPFNGSHSNHFWWVRHPGDGLTLGTLPFQNTFSRAPSPRRGIRSIHPKLRQLVTRNSSVEWKVAQANSVSNRLRRDPCEQSLFSCEWSLDCFSCEKRRGKL